MMQQWKIAIAEDHAILRAGLKEILSAIPEFNCIGEAHDGKSAINLANKLSPDIILMDLSMPNTNGTEAISVIKRRSPQVKILVLTVHSAEEYIRAALEAGADGYMLKDDNKQDLVSALHSVLAGNAYLSPSICKSVINGFLRKPTDNDASNRPWDILTERERVVIKLIAEGKKKNEIASYLSISPNTVEKHRSNLMKKLDLHNIQAITSFAIENGAVNQCVVC